MEGWDTESKCCDNCRRYTWYYDKCHKWDCEVDARSVHDCFEKKDDTSNGSDE